MVVSRGTHFLTRVIIDGKENTDFRYLTGDYIGNTNGVSNYVYLQKGTHNVRLEYRIAQDHQVVSYSYDGRVAFLKVHYSQPGKQYVPP